MSPNRHIFWPVCQTWRVPILKNMWLQHGIAERGWNSVTLFGTWHGTTCDSVFNLLSQCVSGSYVLTVFFSVHHVGRTESGYVGNFLLGLEPSVLSCSKQPGRDLLASRHPTVLASQVAWIEAVQFTNVQQHLLVPMYTYSVQIVHGSTV